MVTDHGKTEKTLGPKIPEVTATLIRSAVTMCEVISVTMVVQQTNVPP